MFEIIVGMFVILLAWVVIMSRRKHAYWKNKGVPYLRPLPLIGNTLSVLLLWESRGESYKKIYQRAKALGLRYVGIYEMSNPTLMLIHPEEISRVLVKDSEHFSQTVESPVLGPKIRWALFNLHGDTWRSMRKLTSPAYSSGKLRTMLPAMLGATQVITDVIEAQPQDTRVIQFTQLYGTRVAVNCLFGLQVHPDTLSQLISHRNKSVRPSWIKYIKLMIILYLPKWSAYLRLKHLSVNSRDPFEELVKDCLKQHRENDMMTGDFIKYLLQVKQRLQNDKNIPSDAFAEEKMEGENVDPYLMSQLFFFLATDFESLQSVLIELSLNPKIQDRAWKEVQDLTIKYGSFTYDALKEATFLRNCIHEGLRKWNVNPTVVRTCTKSYELSSDVKLEVGTKVIISIKGLHSDPDHFPDPDRFDPDRFTRGVTPFTYMSFGVGSRQCIAMRYVLQALAVATATILLSYDVSLSAKTKMPLKESVRTIGTKFQNQIYFNFEKRNSKYT